MFKHFLLFMGVLLLVLGVITVSLTIMSTVFILSMYLAPILLAVMGTVVVLKYKKHKANKDENDD